jgi:hypothetical protein
LKFILEFLYLNKTIRKLIGMFFVTAAISLSAALQLIVLPINGITAYLSNGLIADAWAQSATQTSAETTPARQEETTQTPQVQGTPPISSPSTTSPGGQNKPAAEPARQGGEGPLPAPQVQGSPPMSLPSTTSPEEHKQPAAEPAFQEGGVSQPEQSQMQGPPRPGFFDIMHEDLSEGILATANWLDSFFGDKRFANDANTSYIRVRYNAFMEQGSPAVIKPDFAVRAVLPQLRQKTHLLIWGSPKEDNEFSATQTHTTQEQLATTKERNVTAALQIVPHETVDSSFFLGGGAKFSATGVGFTGGPRYQLRVPFETGWTFRFVEDLAWRTDGPWQSRSTFDLERPLPHDLFFRTSMDLIDTEHADGYIYTLDFNVRQPFGYRRALEYDWINIFQTKPVHELTEVDLRINYRQRIWRDWLYFEVMPQYRFPRSGNFEAIPGILFRLDMIFGSYT